MKNYIKIKKMSDEIYLLFFDFDNTITKEGSFSKVFSHIKSKEINEEISKCIKNLHWSKLHNLILNELKKINYSLTDMKKSISEIGLSPGMIELLNYLKENKNKYYPYVLTSNMDVFVKNYLKNKNLIEIFKDVRGIKSYEDENENSAKIIMNTNEKKPDCDLCQKDICKSFEAKKIMKEYKDKKIKKVIFICDGKNDYCLARNLRENDSLFIRKNYGLYKKLYDEGLDRNLKCEKIVWESAIDIKNYLEKMSF